MKRLIICFSFILLLAVSVHAQISLHGVVRSVDNKLISQVKVEVYNSNNQLVATQITGQNGQYLFTGLPPSPNYYLKASRNINYLDGVSTFDVVVIARHILGIEPFEDPYQIIASDVNLTRSITTLDLIELRRLILGMTDVFPEKEPWVFIPEQLISGSPSQILSSISNLIPVPIVGTSVDFDLKGIKLGDVNFNAAIN